MSTKEARERCMRKQPNECVHCGDTDDLVAHHKNGDRRDNRLENLVVMCRSCHTRLHTKKDVAGKLAELRSLLPQETLSFSNDPTDSMVEMLDWFEQHPCSCATIGHISDATGWSRETVRSNLKLLRAGNYAERMHEPTGEYRLIKDPREDND